MMIRQLQFLCLTFQMLIVVYHVDNIGLDGMQSISFDKNGKTKWHQDSDLAYVYPLDGVIGGYEKENILLDGNNQNVRWTPTLMICS